MKNILSLPIVRVTLVIFSSLVFSSSCSNNLTVSGDYPSPVIKRLPYIAGVVFDQKFSDYQYVESNEGRSELTIKTGAALVKLFSTILPAMFDKVVVLDNLGKSEGMKNVDLIINPTLTDFQYSVPSETSFTMFEVWLKFNIKVFEADGKPIADWIMTSYGKTPSLFMQTKEGALNQAVNVALRDAGAVLSLSFVRVPEVRIWLENHQHPAEIKLSNDVKISSWQTKSGRVKSKVNYN